MVLASADTKIEDSNENTDKKDTDENGKSNPSDATDNKNGDNSGNKDAGNTDSSGNNNSQSNNIGDSTSSKDNKTDTKNTGSNSTSTANVTPQYKVTVDTAAEEKKPAEQYSTENKTDDGTTVKNSDTEKQSSGTEIAGIDEGLDADETAISSNADTASEKSQSMPVWGIILIVVVAAIAVSGTVLFIRNKKKQK